MAGIFRGMSREERVDRLRQAFYAEKILRNAAARQTYTPSSSPIFSVKDVYIDPGSSYKVLDQGERGELIYAEVATNSTLVTPEIKLWNDIGQPVTTINDISFFELLKLGRGMTPGRVQASAPGQTQDEVSDFLPNMFHIARYKDDTLADWTDESDRYIVGRFVATIPFPYSTITFYIKNTTTEESKRIYWASVARTVYEPAGFQERLEKIVPENIGSVELADAVEVEVEDEQDIPGEPFHNVRYDVTPATNSS